MLVAEKQLDDLVDEFKAKVKALIPQLVKEQHAELWAEHQKIVFRLNDLEQEVAKLKDQPIWAGGTPDEMR
jgi:hypothetical protein